jgi:hypothetical protein
LALTVWPHEYLKNRPSWSPIHCCQNYVILTVETSSQNNLASSVIFQKICLLLRVNNSPTCGNLPNLVTKGIYIHAAHKTLTTLIPLEV